MYQLLVKAGKNTELFAKMALEKQCYLKASVDNIIEVKAKTG